MRRKTIIALLFTSIIMLPLVFSGGLQAFQHYIKYSVEERLQNEALVTVTIPLAQVQWMEEGREILVRGKMFDIKSFSETEGNLIALGVFDEKETMVMELLNNFNEKQQNHVLVQLLFMIQAVVGCVCFLLLLSHYSSLLKHISFHLLRKPIPFSLRFFQPPRRLAL